MVYNVCVWWWFECACVLFTVIQKLMRHKQYTKASWKWCQQENPLCELNKNPVAYWTLLFDYSYSFCVYFAIAVYCPPLSWSAVHWTIERKKKKIELQIKNKNEKKASIIAEKLCGVHEFLRMKFEEGPQYCLNWLPQFFFSSSIQLFWLHSASTPCARRHILSNTWVSCYISIDTLDTFRRNVMITFSENMKDGISIHHPRLTMTLLFFTCGSNKQMWLMKMGLRWNLRFNFAGWVAEQ